MNGGIDRLQNGMTNMTALRKEFHSIRFAAVKLKMTALLFDCPIQPVEQPVSVCMSRQFSVVLGTSPFNTHRTVSGILAELICSLHIYWRKIERWTKISEIILSGEENVQIGRACSIDK